MVDRTWGTLLICEDAILLETWKSWRWFLVICEISWNTPWQELGVVGYIVKWNVTSHEVSLYRFFQITGRQAHSIASVRVLLSVRRQSSSDFLCERQVQTVQPFHVDLWCSHCPILNQLRVNEWMMTVSHLRCNLSCIRCNAPFLTSVSSKYHSL